MERWKNQSTAILIMILMILGSAFLGSRSSLMELRTKAEQVFLLGSEGDGIGIQNDLEERSAAAYNMTVIARNYLSEGDAVIQAVLEAREELAAAEGPGEKYEADQELETAVKDLKAKLEGLELTEKDAPYPQRLYTDFLSRGETISHDPYNSLAADFNEALKEFPANILSRLTGVKELELFS